MIIQRGMGDQPQDFVNSMEQTFQPPALPVWQYLVLAGAFFWFAMGLGEHAYKKYGGKGRA